MSKNSEPSKADTADKTNVNMEPDVNGSIGDGVEDVSDLPLTGAAADAAR